MSAPRVLAEAVARGLAVVPAPGGGLTLWGPPEAKTPALMRALKAYREDLLELLGGEGLCPEAEASTDAGTSPASPKAERPAKAPLPVQQLQQPWNPDAYVRTIPLHTPRLRDWLWPNGLIVADQAWCRSTEPSVTSPAWWWRYQGESGWRPVPGTPGEAADVPPGEHLEEG